MANRQFNLEFLNGECKNVELPVGDYSYVSNTIKGYTDGTVQNFKVTPNTTLIELTITAQGTLIVNVKDENNVPITNGKIQLTNADHTTVYGAEQNIKNGVVTFNNVPYDAEGIAAFIAQIGSDHGHFPMPDPPMPVNMNATPVSVDVLNDIKSKPMTVTLTDANYNGIAPLNGSVVFSS